MKLIIKTTAFILLISLASCKKKKIENNLNLLTANTWELYQVEFIDSEGNATDVNPIYLSNDCQIDNTHKYTTDNLYINFDECSTNTVSDTLYWYHDEDFTHLKIYASADTSEFLLMSKNKINKLNETELFLQSVPIFSEDYYYKYYYKIK